MGIKLPIPPQPDESKAVKVGETERVMEEDKVQREEPEMAGGGSTWTNRLMRLKCK